MPMGIENKKPTLVHIIRIFKVFNKVLTNNLRNHDVHLLCLHLLPSPAVPHEPHRTKY